MALRPPHSAKARSDSSVSGSSDTVRVISSTIGRRAGSEGSAIRIPRPSSPVVASSAGPSIAPSVIDPATGAATLTVHNIGARGAGPFAVRVAGEGSREQAAAEVSGLPAPQGYAPSRLQVALAGLDLKPGERVVVTLDAEDAIAEITEDNNTAVLTAVAPQAVAQAMHPVAN